MKSSHTFQTQSRGLYDNYKVPNGDENQEKACAPISLFIDDEYNFTALEHPDSVYIKEALDELDTNWRDRIGFVDIERYSLPWHDLHPEVQATGWVRDCTHYGESLNHRIHYDCF